MNSTKRILNYINNNVEAKKLKKWLYDNELLNTLGIYYDYCLESAEQFSSINKLATQNNLKELLRVCEILKNIKIDYIAFKGVVLSYEIYNNTYSRLCGDIDIFVNNTDYNNALKALLNSGYNFADIPSVKKEHHIVLTNNINILELHKLIFNPDICLNETYLYDNTQNLTFLSKSIRTFDITATFLHLIYHLYMDTWLNHSFYTLLTKKEFNKAERFLYRAYEIALFSEKYFEDIKWEEIINDIKNQNLRIIFKKMILDILEIFPEVFPHSFVDAVSQLDYAYDEMEQLYEYLFEMDMNNSGECFDKLLSNYINDNWKTHKEENIHKKIGEKISLNKKSSDETKQNLNCVINTEKTTEGLNIVFTVSNDDFCISQIDNYNTQASDGVHLLLCSTENYSYNSIFFFPKEVDDEIKVIVCDVLNNRNKVLTDKLIRAEFSKTDENYTITAILSNKFIEENHLSSYFYMGIVISDCSSKTHRRKNHLILSEEDSQWYNPIYFAKISME